MHALIAAYWPAIEADRQLTLVTASAAPHARRDQYRSLVDRLSRARRVLEPSPTPVRMPVERYDPEAARAWFGDAGYEVSSG